MTKRLSVLLAIVTMLRAALPDAEVIGFDEVDQADAPDRVGETGRVAVEAGDPGDPEIDLSPIAYNYVHQIPVQLAVQSSIEPPEQLLDAMIARVATAIGADRTLGGEVEWLDATAPATDALYAEGGAAARETTLILLATYATPHPL